MKFAFLGIDALLLFLLIRSWIKSDRDGGEDAETDAAGVIASTVALGVVNGAWLIFWLLHR
jgi:hypothetical protein